METNNIPLFCPVTHALLREPTPEELAFADKKAALIRTYRNTDLTDEARNAAKAELEAMVEGTSSKPVWDKIIAGEKVEESKPEEGASEEPAFVLKDHLVFDSKHSKTPPNGKVKALLITEKGDTTHFVAVNIWPGATKIPNYNTEEYGQVIGGPAELQDHEWQ